MRPLDAQQEFDQEKVSPDVTKEQVEALMQENAATSSKTPSDITLVDRVMQRHGLTREEAHREIQAFGG